MKRYYFKVTSTVTNVNGFCVVYSDTPLALGQQGIGMYISVFANGPEAAQAAIREPAAGTTWQYVMNPKGE